MRNYRYDETNQFTEDGNNTYPWDANGNPEGTEQAAGVANCLESDKVWNFVYDVEGTLTSKIPIATGKQCSYFFDHGDKLTKAEHRPETICSPRV